MLQVFNYLKDRYMSEKAQGMVEYALILAFVVGIAVVALSSDSGLGGAIKNVFNNVSNNVK